MQKRIPIVVVVLLVLLTIWCTGESYFDGISSTDRVLQTVTEINAHVHNRDRYYGVHGTPSGIVTAGDSTSGDPYVPDAGNDDWGSWLLLLGTGDTPVISGRTRINPHEILITATERATAIHRIQIAWDATSATLALAADEYTEVMFKPSGAAFTSTPISVRSDEIDVGFTVWVRVWSLGQNTGTINMWLGVHED